MQLYPTISSAKAEARQKFFDDTVSFFKGLENDVKIKCVYYCVAINNNKYN